MMGKFIQSRRSNYTYVNTPSTSHLFLMGAEEGIAVESTLFNEKMKRTQRNGETESEATNGFFWPLLGHSKRKQRKL